MTWPPPPRCMCETCVPTTDPDAGHEAEWPDLAYAIAKARDTEEAQP